MAGVAEVILRFRSAGKVNLMENKFSLSSDPLQANEISQRRKLVANFS